MITGGENHLITGGENHMGLENDLLIWYTESGREYNDLPIRGNKEISASREGSSA